LLKSGHITSLRFIFAKEDKPSAITEHNLFCESEANQFVFFLQNRTTI